MFYNKPVDSKTLHKNFIAILKMADVDITKGSYIEEFIRFESSYTMGDWLYNDDTGIAEQFISFFIEEDEKAIRHRKYINNDGLLVKISEEIL